MNKYSIAIGFCLVTGAFLISCDEEPPAKEDTPELITELVLTFTPSGGGTPIEVTATDPDGIGFQPLQADEDITLAPSTTYTLSLQLINGLADPNDPEYFIHDEVEEEGDEHMFFFSWTGGFSNPAGNGNLDNRSDAVNYLDEDANGEPLGLTTQWTTSADAEGEQEFRIVLKHQPGIKSSTSTVQDGETDLDIEFVLIITTPPSSPGNVQGL